MDPKAAEERLRETLADLVESREQQAATSDILRLIGQSRASPEPVFESIAAAAMTLCHAVAANVFTYDGELLHLAATTRTGEHERRLHQSFPRPPDRESGAGRSILTRSVVEIPDVMKDSDYALQSAALVGGFLAVLAVPLMLKGRPIGSIAVGLAKPGTFSPRQIDLLKTFADQAVIALENARLFNELEAEVEAHRRSKAAIRALVEERSSGADSMIGQSPALRRVREQVEKVAATDSTVLIQGETGTGKELVARAIHDASRRRERALIAVNCAAMPRDLVESELFGHEKGSFTGAAQQRRGRFELADGGTLFLDEVGELPLEAQAKLLRVLQQGEFERVGGTRSLHADVRVIAATNRDLPAEVKGGRFRTDLFYRLNVFPIALPPLRARRGDIGPLIKHFASHLARKLGRPIDGVSPAFIERASVYDWPGNIRELENVIERALIISDGGTLDASDLFPVAATSHEGPLPTSTIEEVEREHIRRSLERTQWRIEGATGAAKQLGLNPSTLRGRMRKLGIRKVS
jgi:formate hydrogenlyase transcriptional activator